MRFYDWLMIHRIVDDKSRGHAYTDITPDLEGAMVFDCNPVMQQMVESVQTWTDENGGTRRRINYSERGREILQVQIVSQPPIENGPAIQPTGNKMRQWVGLVPPYDRCFFESELLVDEKTSQRYTYGLLVNRIPQSTIDELRTNTALDSLYAGWNYHGLKRESNPLEVYLESQGFVMTDNEGVPVAIDLNYYDISGTTIPTLGLNGVIGFVSMMLLNQKMLKASRKEPPAKTRQQRRHEERKGNVKPGKTHYYTLELELPTATSSGESAGGGGWEQIWHQVRGHLRHYKSGKVIQVRAHSKGNPIKGVALKDYVVTPSDDTSDNTSGNTAA